jgi:hypothetical protein
MIGKMLISGFLFADNLAIGSSQFMVYRKKFTKP